MSDYSFRCNTTGNTTVDTLRYFTEPDNGTTGSALGVRFNTQADTTTAGFATGPTRIENFRYHDIENSPFDMTVTGTRRFYTEELSKKGKIKQALMQIFKEPGKEILKEMDNDDKKLLEAKRKSEKLLKSWLTKAEYDALVGKGEIEIPSNEEEDVIFIVKKDPNEMVDVKKQGKFSHKLCAVPEDLDFPVGDQLLSKIVLIKTDEKKFKKIAIKHGVRYESNSTL